MTAARPLVTIAIPTFNRAGRIGGAIASALAQTWGDIEIVVSDNASTDDTAAVVARFADPRIRYFRQDSNVGIVRNWDFCLRQVRGVHYLMLSDDDRLVPDAIAALVAALEPPYGMEEIAFAYGTADMSGDADLNPVDADIPAALEPSRDFQVGLLVGSRKCYPSATLLRTANAIAAGGYDNPYRAGVDLGLLFELCARHPRVAHTGTVTTLYVMHQGNFTSRIALNDMLETIGLLAEVARATSLRPDPAAVTTTRDVLRARAGASGYFIMAHYRRRRASAAASVSMFWRHRAWFAGGHGAIPLAKAIVKLAWYALRRPAAVTA